MRYALHSQKISRRFHNCGIRFSVDGLLNDSVKVVIYNGMLDMIVSTPGKIYCQHNC